ncbi:hypothetical protein CR513_12510, partial [Mucuna pruriens]
MEGFQLGIHDKQMFGLHIPKFIMSPKDVCALVPKNPLGLATYGKRRLGLGKLEKGVISSP